MVGTDTPLGVERPRLIGDIVLEQIRNAIIDKRLAPGAKLSEAGLAEMLSVSKTPIREALLQLRMIGLVTVQSGSLRVVLPSLELVQQAYEVRAGLEAVTAELSAERATKEDLVLIRSSAEESDTHAKSDNMPGFRQNDRLFHQHVALSCKNDMAAQQVMNYRDLCQALRQRDVITDQVSRVCGQAHLAIADAICSRDRESARRLMSEHIYYVMARVRASMVSDESLAPPWTISASPAEPVPRQAGHSANASSFSSSKSQPMPGRSGTWTQPFA